MDTRFVCRKQPETANGRCFNVCSVGVVIVRSGEIGGKFFSFIQPLNYYTYWTTGVWSQIEACISGLLFVAYNRSFEGSS